MASNLEYTVGLEVGKAITALRSFQNALAQSQPGVEKLGGSIQKIERTAASSGRGLLEMASSLKTALAGAGAAIGAFEGLRVAADQFKESIKEAASFEQIKVGFTVLLQSGQKAKEMLKDLTAFADTTPFQMPELAQAARTLLAFGVPAREGTQTLPEAFHMMLQGKPQPADADATASQPPMVVQPITPDPGTINGQPVSAALPRPEALGVAVPSLGPQETPADPFAPDPGTINGQSVSAALPRPGTIGVAVPSLAPQLTAPDLNARAQAFVGGATPDSKADPQTAKIVEVLQALHQTVKDNARHDPLRPDATF